MKIDSLTRNISYLNPAKENVREKEDQNVKAGDRDSQREPAHQEQGSKEQKENGENASETAQMDVDQAVEAFQLDAVTQSTGINVTLEGSGPGLKVILKDPAGGIVRSFTGEEFLKLRQSNARDGQKRGKILDQKL